MSYLKKVIKFRRAVSPVVGVILMIGLVVVASVVVFTIFDSFTNQSTTAKDVTVQLHYDKLIIGNKGSADINVTQITSDSVTLNFSVIVPVGHAVSFDVSSIIHENEVPNAVVFVDLINKIEHTKTFVS